MAVYTARQRAPYFWVMTGSNTFTLTVESAGTIQVPVTSSACINSTGGASKKCTFRLYDASGTVVELNPPEDGIEATVAADGTCSATPANTLSTASDLYSCRWHWGDSSTTALIFDREMIVCRSAPRCPIGPSDLERRLSATRGDWELPAGKTWSDYCDEAWDQTVARCFAAGTGAHKIASWYGFREYVLRVTEAQIARDLMLTRSGATKWQYLYEALMGPALDPRSIEWEWAHLGFRTDRNQDGVPDYGSESESKPNSFHQSTDPSGWRGF